MAAIHAVIAGGQQDAGSLTVSLAPSTLSTSYSGSSSHVTSTVTATPSGGSGSYTYSWTKTTNNDPLLTVVSPTSQTTAFSAQAMAAYDLYSDTFRVTVTDSLQPSKTGYANILVTVSRLS